MTNTVPSKTFPVIESQYEAMLVKIKDYQGVQNLAITGTTGHATFEGVDFSWSWDPINSGELTVAILGRHGFKASLVSDDYIFAQIQKNLTA